MQCFQKDPNLRISAKKLLRHPWIAAVKRADAVPVKPTKYDEAVKTVQEWNEALKSPESTIHRGRVGSLSPMPDKYNQRLSLMTSEAASKAPTAGNQTQRMSGTMYPSPDDLDNNVWDDDFASSISSRGLQLPAHLKPVDNFAGALSSEKLKAYATTEEGNTFKVHGKSKGSNAEARNSTTLALVDDQDTVRASSPVKTRQAKQQPGKSDRPASRASRIPSQPKTQILRTQKKPSIPAQPARRPQPLKRSSSVFKEESTGDYSDLIVEDEDAFDQKIDQIRKVR